MIQIANNYSYFYDKKCDDLLIKNNSNEPRYAEEVYNNIYLIKSELDDSIIGIQILYYKKRSNKTLKQYLPENFYEMAQNICV